MVTLTRVSADDVFVQLLDLPTTTKEAVTCNDDGSYTIFINARLSFDSQIKAYDHAMRHIQNADFTKDDVQTIEYIAHQQDEKRVPAQKYVEELMAIKKRRKQLKRLMQKDEERVRFLSEKYDMFDVAEKQWLYGNDL